MTMHDDLYNEQAMEVRAQALVDVAELALAFGRIDRTGPCHPDGTPESDSDHTVMLGWVAPALAELINHRMGFNHYNVDRIAAFALVHDAAEVHAGDTCTIRITEDELQDKAVREAAATAKIYGHFHATLPWFARMVAQYEDQTTKEARFVRAVDKVLPKMVHLVDKRIGLKKEGVSRAEFIALMRRQRQQVSENVPAGSTFILGLYDILCERVLAGWPMNEEISLPPRSPQRHTLTAGGWGGFTLVHVSCSYGDQVLTCPYTLAFELCSHGGAEWPEIITQVGAHGTYDVALDERGLLIEKVD